MALGSVCGNSFPGSHLLPEERSCSAQRSSQPATCEQAGSHSRWTEFGCCRAKCWAVAFIEAKPVINVNTLSFACWLGVFGNFVVFILAMQRRQANIDEQISQSLSLRAFICIRLLSKPAMTYKYQTYLIIKNPQSRGEGLTNTRMNLSLLPICR